MTRPFRYLLMSLALSLALMGACASAAHANDFGPWYQGTGTFGKENPSAFKAQVITFDDPSVAQIADFTCTYPTGAPITTDEQNVLSGLFADAGQAYEGKLTNSNGTMSAYATVGGQQGMDEFLAGAKQMLLAGMYPAAGYSHVSTYSDNKWPTGQATTAANLHRDAIIKEENAYRVWNTGQPPEPLAKWQASAPGRTAWRALQVAEKALGLNWVGGGTGLVLDPQLADTYVNPGATNPLELAAGTPNYTGTSQSGADYPQVPQGCGLNPIVADNVNFIDLITNTGNFFTDLVLYIPSHIASESYNFLQPYAFLYTFWTPHTERGDTMFNISTSCNTLGAANASEVSDTCNGATPLGFSKQRLQLQNETGEWYLSAAIFLQWLVSGFYFIILFTSAIVYMVRGQKSAQFNVLQLIPKLILSVLLTMFGMDIIGLLISFSNMFVTSLFGFDNMRSVGRISDILGQTGTYLSGAGSFVAQLSNTVFGLWSVFFFAFFVITALLRQLMLIALVVIMPLACFCLVNPKWQGQFHRYCKALLAVVFIPPVMAFVLKIGITLNPIVNAGGDVGVGTGFLGLVMLMGTMWLMTKVVKMGAAAATGNQAMMGSLTGRAMGKIGGYATMAGAAGLGGPLVGGALYAAGKGMQAGSSISAAGEGVGASLIPAGAGGGGSMPGLAGAARRLGLPSAGGSSFGSGGGGGGLAGRLAGQVAGGRGLEQRFGQFLEMREGDRGERRISGRMAQGRRARENEAVAKHLQGVQSGAGHKLSVGEIKSAKDEFYNGQYARDEEGRVVYEDGKEVRDRSAGADTGWYAKHGRMYKRAGSWHVAATEESMETPSLTGARVRAAAAGAADTSRFVGGAFASVADGTIGAAGRAVAGTAPAQSVYTGAAAAAARAKGAAATAGSALGSASSAAFSESGLRDAAIKAAIAADAVRHSPAGEAAARGVQSAAAAPEAARVARRNRRHGEGGWTEGTAEGPGVAPSAEEARAQRRTARSAVDDELDRDMAAAQDAAPRDGE